MGMGLFFRSNKSTDVKIKNYKTILKLKSSNIEIYIDRPSVKKGDVITVYKGTNNQAMSLRCDSEIYIDERGRMVVDVTELNTFVTESYSNIDIPDYI